jgi:hypothetical protein
MDMPKGIIPYEETSFHEECVVKQAISDAGSASIEISPHDDLEQAEQIASQATFVMAQTIPSSLVRPKGHKRKRQKRKKVDTNVGDYSIGAHGSSMQTRVPIQMMVPTTSVPNQVGATHMMRYPLFFAILGIIK